MLLRECGLVALFLSTFEKPIDKKGRVSVPPSFRAAVQDEAFNGVVAYGSFVHDCIELCGMQRMEHLHAQIEALDPFSEERDAFATAVLGGAVQLAFDTEGRIILPESFLDDMKIEKTCVFVGKGATFEIWAPEAFKAHAAQAKAFAKARRGFLKAPKSQEG